jgi:hypothetical protein
LSLGNQPRRARAAKILDALTLRHGLGRQSAAKDGGFTRGVAALDIGAIEVDLDAGHRTVELPVVTDVRAVKRSLRGNAIDGMLGLRNQRKKGST